MGGLDVVEILDDVLLAKGTGGHIVVVAKQEAQLSEIVASRTRGIMFSGKKVCELHKQALRFCMEQNFS